jgi:hypothetical protein
MAHFTVRVELHDAQWSDYNQLHLAMEQRGFSRQITSDDGETYQMPWAEYNGAANLTSVQVLDLAKGAADTTRKQYSVLVTEAASRAWVGLTAA